MGRLDKIVAGRGRRQREWCGQDRRGSRAGKEEELCGFLEI
ncbi:MAG: hypothetical protein QMD08_07700 [Actinomycetota bacterium]|nr:hypothetical protein [Actinomycetota bacterium]